MGLRIENAVAGDRLGAVVTFLVLGAVYNFMLTYLNWSIG